MRSKVETPVGPINVTIPAEWQSSWILTTAGLVLLLGGWIVFRAGSRLLALAMGAGFGFFIGEVLGVILKVDRQSSLLITAGCCAVGGIAALVMIRAVTNMLFAIIGLLFGALLGRVGAEIYAQMNHTEFVLSQQTGLIILGVAVAVALLSIWLQRLIMILVTSYMGATFLVAGVEYLSQRALAFPAVMAAGVIWQGFVLGRIFRVQHNRKRDKRRAADDTE